MLKKLCLTLFIWCLFTINSYAIAQKGLYLTGNFLYSIPMLPAVKKNQILILPQTDNQKLVLKARDPALLSPAPELVFGLGYQFNQRFGMDETINYLDGQSLDVVWKGKMFNHPGIYTFHSTASSLLAMTNFNFTPTIYSMNGGGNWLPYLGFGLGASLNHLRVIHFQPAGPTEYYSTHSTGTVAWQMTLGAAFHLNPDLTFTTGYRLFSQGRQARGGQSNSCDYMLKTLSQFRPKTTISSDLFFGFQYHL